MDGGSQIEDNAKEGSIVYIHKGLRMVKFLDGS